MGPRRSLEATLAALALFAAGAAHAEETLAEEALAGEAPTGEALTDRAEDLPPLALMGSVPIVWGEPGQFVDLIGQANPPHWARTLLERRWRLVPLDFLDQAALAGQDRLLMAQPRGLAPQENVALDAWVRGGGHLLLLADPLMTGASRYPLGDRRRPTEAALLSPILAHWGLALQFDPDQPPGLQSRDVAGRRVPVNLAGRLVAQAGGDSHCDLPAQGLLARCALGRGQVVILADAALVDLAGPWDGAPEALEALLDLAFAPDGEIAGDRAASMPTAPAGDAKPPISSRISVQGETAGN